MIIHSKYFLVFPPYKLSVFLKNVRHFLYTRPYTAISRKAVGKCARDNPER